MDRLQPDQPGFAGMLIALLRGPVHATHAQLLPSHPPGRQVEWLATAETLPSLEVSPPGWLFRLEQETAPGAVLFVATTHACAVSDPRVQGAALLCRIAWRMHGASEESPMPDNLAESIHALRNGLNSTVMNAAVLGARKDELPLELHPILGRIETAAGRSAQELHRLVALLEDVR